MHIADDAYGVNGVRCWGSHFNWKCFI